MIFKGLSVARNCVRPESAPFHWKQLKATFLEGESSTLISLWVTKLNQDS